MSKRPPPPRCTCTYGQALAEPTLLTVRLLARQLRIPPERVIALAIASYAAEVERNHWLRKLADAEPAA